MPRIVKNLTIFSHVDPWQNAQKPDSNFMQYVSLTFERAGDIIYTEREIKKGIKKMVGIFKYESGLKFKAVSENELTAKKYLFDKFALPYEKELFTAEEWWEHGLKFHSGAPVCYEIREIEVWN